MRLHRGVQEALWTLATAILSIGAGGTAGTLGTVLVFLLPAGSSLMLGAQLAAIALAASAGWFALRRFVRR